MARRINLHNIGHGILHKGVESLMGGRKRQGYPQTRRRRPLHIIVGVVACVVVGWIVGYMFVTSHRVEQEVVPPVQQESPVEMAARVPVQGEEAEEQPAGLPPGEEVAGPSSAEEELPGTAVGVAPPPEEPAQVSEVPALEEQVVAAGTETAEEAAVDEEREVWEGVPVEPAEERTPSPVVEEEVIPARDVGEEEMVLPTATVEDLIAEGEPEEEITAARTTAPAEVAEAPKDALPEAEAPAEVAALEPPPPPEMTLVQPEELPYGVHVASYRSQEQAIKDVTDLLQRGQQALAIPVAIPGKGTWYRVLVGRYANLEEASEQGARLKVEEGFDYAAPTVLPYLVGVSMFQTLTVAGFKEAKLRDRGYNTLIVPVRGKEEGSIRYRLCVGVFEDPEEAEVVSRRLQKEGIANTVFRP